MSRIVEKEPFIQQLTLTYSKDVEGVFKSRSKATKWSVHLEDKKESRKIWSLHNPIRYYVKSQKNKIAFFWFESQITCRIRLEMSNMFIRPIAWQHQTIHVPYLSVALRPTESHTKNKISQERVVSLKFLITSYMREPLWFHPDPWFSSSQSHGQQQQHRAADRLPRFPGPKQLQAPSPLLQPALRTDLLQQRVRTPVRGRLLRLLLLARSALPGLLQRVI